MLYNRVVLYNFVRHIPSSSPQSVIAGSAEMPYNLFARFESAVAVGLQQFSEFIDLTL